MKNNFYIFVASDLDFKITSPIIHAISNLTIKP